MIGALLLLLGFLMLEIVQPSQILCPFCDKVLVNKVDNVKDWIDEDGSDDFEKKCRLTDSFEDEYGYKYNKVLNKDSYKGDTKNIVNKNNNKNNDKYSNLNHTGSGNHTSSDDIHEPMLAVLQSGGTYSTTMPSGAARHYTPEDLADISFDVDGNRSD